MARPKSKSELLALSSENFNLLLTLVHSYSQEQQEMEFPDKYMNRNIRDVLCHLYHWHLMMLEWYDVGMAGQKPEMPARGYTWKTVPELNKLIQEKYSQTPLPEALEQLRKSHATITALIERHTNDELFEKRRYTWTGTTSLGAYLISATSSHYDWAIKLIKKALKMTLVVV